METFTFDNADAIYAELDSDTDLYCVDEGIYFFKYNEAGSIAYYYLSPKELIKAAKAADGYIGSALGPGGSIIDVCVVNPKGEIIEYDDPEFDDYYNNPKCDIDVTDICDFLSRFVGMRFIYADSESVAALDPKDFNN